MGPSQQGVATTLGMVLTEEHEKAAGEGGPGGQFHGEASSMFLPLKGLLPQVLN